MSSSSSPSNQDSHIPSRAKIIAIDGPAGAGKSTVAARVADALGYLYIDTGAMYRAITWLVLENNINMQDYETIVKLASTAEIELVSKIDNGSRQLQVLINDVNVTSAIRLPNVTRYVSPISAIPGVRQHLVAQQQKLASRGAVVMDGRDIGTVVLPNADLKIFLNASPHVRAQRRLKDLQQLQQSVDFPALLEEIKQRDIQDSTRAVAPLRQAQDAIPINTDLLSVDQVVGRILNLCEPG